jgi:phospholipid transport system transporter-binding protein
MFQPGTTLTFDNAKTALDAGLQAIAEGQTVIDCASLVAVDSAAVGTLLAWRRAALIRARPLAFTNLPANLRSLVSLYDVSDLLDFETMLPATAVSASAARADLPHH